MWLLYGTIWLVSFATPVATAPALFLTPYINEGRIEQARNISTVNPSLFLDIKSHSGFITVDARYHSNIFMWYFPVTGKPITKTPWIIWLQGGPGASSLTGLFDEIGPFEYDTATRKLKARKYAWTKMYSVVFIDNPVGAGFSFTNSENGMVRDVNTCVLYLVEALRQFLIIFKELVTAPLYIAGESYAGVYLSTLGLKIHNQDNHSKLLNCNFQGVIMGNPLLSRIATANYTLAHHRWGLIDSQGALAVKTLQDAYIEALRKGEAYRAYDLRHLLLDKLSNITQLYRIYNVMQNNSKDNLEDFVHFLKRKKIRDAIHVGSIAFSFTNASVSYMMASDFLAEGGPQTMVLLNKYKVMIYCGILDLMTPCVDDAHYRRTTWTWEYEDKFFHAPRIPWWFNNSLTGYTKQGGHLTEVLVLGAGHMVAIEKPAELYYLITNFIEGTALPVHPKFVYSPDDTPIFVTREKNAAKDTDFSIYKGWLIATVLINALLLLCSCSCVIFLKM